MSRLPKLPRRLSPDEFFFSEVSRLWKAFCGDIDFPWPPWQWVAQVCIDMPDGRQDFVIAFDSGQLTCRAGRVDSPLVSVYVDRSGYEAGVHTMLRQVLKHTDENLDEARNALKHYLETGARSLNLNELAQQAGTILVHYTDDAGDSSDHRFVLGNGMGPLAHIEANDADLWSFLNAKGKILRLVRNLRISGDAGYVIRLAATLAPDAA